MKENTTKSFRLPLSTEKKELLGRLVQESSYRQRIDK